MTFQRITTEVLTAMGLLETPDVRKIATQLDLQRVEGKLMAAVQQLEAVMDHNTRAVKGLREHEFD